MKKNWLSALLLMVLMLGLSACEKEEEENDPPPVVVDPCDEVNSAFADEVLPIFLTSCGVSGCHSLSAAEGGVVFTNYTSIKNSIEMDQDQFLESINFIGGTSDWMPRSEIDENATEDDKLPQSQIDKIECWIDRGMPND